MRLFRAAAITVLTAALAWSATACGTDSGSAAPASGLRPRVVASTSWVGALAKAAGATDIRLIVPAGTPDPAAYDPTPADLAAMADADLVLYAETDSFAAELKATVTAHGKLIVVRPENAPKKIDVEVTKLAGFFGTPRATANWLATFKAEYAKLSGRLKANRTGPAPAAVATPSTAPWASFAGLRLAATYGPGPVSAAQLKTVTAKKPAVVLADATVPAPALAGARRVEIVNYPAEDLDLLAVFRSNAAALGSLGS